ncbi:MAG: AAA family ATPase, partial [Treponema sp.]|nr:AAA family ATPase [Treponema sp.]
MGNIHIDSLDIETYRGIKNLKLEGFTGVNILTGDNNCGKTSVLELLHTLSGPTQLQTWLAHIRRPSAGMSNITFYEGLLDLFSKNEKSEQEVKYSVTNSKSVNHGITVSYEIIPSTVSTRKAN